MSHIPVPERPPNAGLDQISTRWPLIQEPATFVLRYAPAIQGYLGVFLKNPDDVEDVRQAFLLRIFEKGIVERNLIRGRFRDYLIAAVRNAALAHLRRRSLDRHFLPLDDLADPAPFEFPADSEWLARWRRALLDSVWEVLENHERNHPGNLAYSSLRQLVDHPQENSRQLAARLSRQCKRTIYSEAFRKQVSRARRLFAGFLVAEVARTLENPSPLHIEEELIELDLMKHVRPFLPADWRTGGKLLDAE